MLWLRKYVPVWLLLVTVIGVAIAADSGAIASSLRTAFLPRPDFTLTASPNPTRILVEGYPHQGTMIRIGAVNDFSGEVDLTVPSSPSGLLVSNTGPGSAFFPGPDQSLNLTFATTSGIGNYSVTIIGTSGRLSHSVALTVIAQGLSLDRNQINVTSGSSITSKVTVTSLNGFAGDFALNYAPQVPPHIDPGFAASGTANIALAARGTATLTITISANPQFRYGLLSIGVTTPLGVLGFTLAIVAS